MEVLLLEVLLEISFAVASGSVVAMVEVVRYETSAVISIGVVDVA